MSFVHVISHMTLRLWPTLTPHGRDLLGTGAKHWDTGLGFRRSVARKTNGLSSPIRDLSDPCTIPWEYLTPTETLSLTTRARTYSQFRSILEGEKVNDAKVAYTWMNVHLFLVKYFWLSAHDDTNGSRPRCQIKVPRP